MTKKLDIRPKTRRRLRLESEALKKNGHRRSPGNRTKAENCPHNKQSKKAKKAEPDQ